MKKILLTTVIALQSCINQGPIQVFYEQNNKQLNDNEKNIDLLNPKEKFLVSFIGIYKDDDVRLLVDEKEVYHKKLTNKDSSTREFVDLYMGDKPKEKLQIFINDKIVAFEANKIEQKRYLTVDKYGYKKIFLSKSPIFKGSDNFIDDSLTKNSRGFIPLAH